MNHSGRFCVSRSLNSCSFSGRAGQKGERPKRSHCCFACIGQCLCFSLLHHAWNILKEEPLVLSNISSCSLPKTGQTAMEIMRAIYEVRLVSFHRKYHPSGYQCVHRNVLFTPELCFLWCCHPSASKSPYLPGDPDSANLAFHPLLDEWVRDAGQRCCAGLHC